MKIISELKNEIKSTIKHRKNFKRWQINHDRHAPRVGDLAPDFTLFDVTGTQSVTLSNFRGKKPVVLLFGSFT